MRKVKSIICNDIALNEDNHTRIIHYTIEKVDGTMTDIKTELPKYCRLEKSNEIIRDNSEFINGYKVVKTGNNEYAYVSESDNTLLPYRYDIATDFNNLGFAMVGKDGTVSWINKDFKYLDYRGNMIEEELDKSWSKFKGWQCVNGFSEGDIPLARVCEKRDLFPRVAYFGTDERLREFVKYGDDKTRVTVFKIGEDFNASNYALAGNDILFARGYFITYKDLIMIGEKEGFIDHIKEEAESKLKVLK